MAVIGGAPLPVTTGGSGQTEARPAVPVYVVSGGQAPVGGRARRVVVVTSGPVDGGAPIPVYDAGADALYSADAALPVYVVSGSLGSNPLAYALFRDLFTDAQNPLVDGNAQPGAGKRDVTGSLWKNVSNALRGGGQPSSPAWGSSKYVGTDNASAGYARVAGRTLAMLVIPEDTITTADLVLGWDIATNTSDPRTVGHQFVTESGGNFKVAANGVKVTIDSGTRNLRPMQYLFGVTLNTTGAVVWISSFGADTFASPNGGMVDIVGVPAYPSARILWVDDGGSAATLYPSIQALGTLSYPNGNAVQDVRVKDVASWSATDAMAAFADRFTRADSAVSMSNNWATDNGTAGISSNKAYFPVISSGFGRVYQPNALPSGGDGFVCCDITVPTTAGTGFGLMLRRQDSSNYIRVWSNNTTNAIHIQTFVGGAFGASIASTTSGISWVAGATNRWVIGMLGAKYRVWIDGVDVFTAWQSDSNSRFITSRDCGLYSSNGTAFTTTRWDNFAVYGWTFTIPTEIAAGACPVIYTAGSTLASDTFTDTNGTALASHTPTSGSAWATPTGTWTIQSNRASCNKAAGVNHATQDAGAANAEAQVDVITPGSFATNTIRAGIVLRRGSANDYLSVRLYKDNSQPSNDEVEIQEFIGGSGAIVKKVNLGGYFAVSTTYTLKCQIATDPNGGDDLLHVWLDGKPRLSYKLSGANTSTRFGLHLDSADDGCVFDSWSVKAL